MKRILVYGLAGVFLGTAFGGAASLAASEYDRGKKIYEDKCVICHGRDGKGNGPAAAAFNPRPADFNSPEFWQRMNDEKIANIVTKGHGMMPSFDLTPDQIKAIIDYLKQAFKK
jgi:mono/diheme cytochrome c family protein